MRLELTILSLLAACGIDTGQCEPRDPWPFEHADHVTEAQQADVLPSLDSESLADVPCENICARIALIGGRLDSVESCTYTHYDEPLPLGEADTGLAGDTGESSPSDQVAVGFLECSGTVGQICLGRRPLGHVEAHEAGHELGPWLALAAHLEAASVDAFEQLAERLAAWGAPSELVERCHQYAIEEQRHAAWMGRLARRHGAKLLPVEQEPAPQTLMSLALQNAREGCAGEAWAAVLCAHISEQAEDAEVRAVHRRLALDEVHHATLSVALHRWFLAQLPTEQAAQVEGVRQQSLAALPVLAARQADELPVELGISDPQALVALARGVVERLAA